MIADTDLLIVAMWVFAYVILYVLADREEAGWFHVFGGVVAIFLALHLFSVLGSVPLAVTFAALGIWTIVLGIAKELG